MKILKILAGIIAAILVIYLLLCVIGPKNMSQSHTIEIDAPARVIYNNIADFKNWPKWGPWMEADPNMELSFGETTSGVGGNYSWKSESQGDGAMEITEAVPNKSMKTKLTFVDWEGTSQGSWNIEPGTDGKQKVDWGFDSSPTPFMMRGMMFMMQGSMEKMFANGLKKLNEVCLEDKAALPKFDIKTVDFPATTFSGVKKKLSMMDMQPFLAESFGALFAKGGKKLAGPPSGLYFDWNEETMQTEMAAAVAVSEPIEGFETISIPAGKAIQIDYMGSYEGIGDAHWAIDDYMQANGLEGTMPCIETYVTDPMAEPDTSKWLTQLTYPLK